MHASPTRAGLWLPVVAYMAMLFGFSSLSTLPAPPGNLSFYNVHIAAYAGLGALTARALGGGFRRVSWRDVLWAIVISTLYGVSDEYHQHFVPGRTFDVFDMAADCAGSAIGAAAVRACSIIFRVPNRDAL